MHCPSFEQLSSFRKAPTMSNYTDPSSDFKLYHAGSSSRITDRNLMILNKFLNELGLPDKFHECYLAVHLATDWSKIQDYKALSMWVMAKKLAANNSEVHKTVYERLKKKWRFFLDFLDSRGITLIAFRRIQEFHKTIIEYDYDYGTLNMLWSLPLDLPMAKVDATVERAAQKSKRGDSLIEPKIPRTRSNESLADSAVRLLVKLKESTRSEAEYIVELELSLERLGVDPNLIPGLTSHM